MVLLHSFKRLACLLALGTSVLCSGCSKTACFQWTAAEDECPSQDEALEYFADSTCPALSAIESVDSEGEFDEDACCYTVTERDDDEEFFVDCFGKGGSVVAVTGVSSGGGFGGSSSTGGGFGGGGGGVGGSSGQGGASNCIRCAEALAGGDPSSLCDDSTPIFKELLDCTCTGVCASACSADCIEGQASSQPCLDCMANSMMGCGEQFNACANDI